jgi:DNA polymerase-4
MIHFDLDAFFCAVEEQRDPTLAGKPFAVGGRPEERGVVASCSYAARQMGVHSAMPMSRALRLCPSLIIAPARHSAYRAVSQQAMARLHALTSQVEQLSIDEAFLDVSDLSETAEMIARRLQATIRAELNLPCSLGVAGNKLVAKIANNVGKAANRGPHPPNAITVVEPGREAEFLAPLPADELWGVGPKTAQRLAALGVHTIGDIGQQPVCELVRLFGKHGEKMARHARGLDDQPIITTHEPKSISQEVTFVRNVNDAGVLHKELDEQARKVGAELRRKGLSAGVVKIKLRWADFTTQTRQTTLERPSDDGAQIARVADQLLQRVWDGRPLRLIGVGVSGLTNEARQMSLWDQAGERDEQLQQTLDELRVRYGEKVIHRASDLLPG